MNAANPFNFCYNISVVVLFNSFMSIPVHWFARKIFFLLKLHRYIHMDSKLNSAHRQTLLRRKNLIHL